MVERYMTHGLLLAVLVLLLPLLLSARLAPGPAGGDVVGYVAADSGGTAARLGVQLVQLGDDSPGVVIYGGGLVSMPITSFAHPCPHFVEQLVVGELG